MAGFYGEMNSFTSKLSQLNYCGYNATLNFHTFNGRMYASLHADLGSAELTYSYDQQQFKKKTKPSRIRRRMRRKHASNNTEKNITTNDVALNDCEIVHEDNFDAIASLNNSFHNDEQLIDLQESDSIVQSSAIESMGSNHSESAIIHDELIVPRSDSSTCYLFDKGNASSFSSEVPSQDDASVKATSLTPKEEQMMLTMYALLQDMNSRM